MKMMIDFSFNFSKKQIPTHGQFVSIESNIIFIIFSKTLPVLTWGADVDAVWRHVNST